MHFKLLAPLIILMIISAGCDTPTDAGLGLAGGQAGDPISYSVAPTTFESSEVRDITGGTSRVLAGSVSDPLLGTMSGIGYLDFELGASLTTNFTDGPVTSVKLTLRPNYFYGDTTISPTLILTDLTDEWLDTGANSDTMLTAGSEISQNVFSKADSLWIVELPATWVADNDTTLRSVFFNTAFNGFQIGTDATNLVTGFSREQSSLEIISGGDTLVFPAGKSLTSVDKTLDAADVPGRVLIQDGSRLGINIYVDESSSDSLAKSVISKTSLTIAADTAAVDTTPVNFVRPMVTALELFGSTGAGIDVQIGIVEMNDEGRFVFESDLYRDVIQQQLTGNDIFDEFFIRVPINENTLNGVLIYDVSDPVNAPELSVTASLFE